MNLSLLVFRSEHHVFDLDLPGVEHLLLHFEQALGMAACAKIRSVLANHFSGFAAIIGARGEFVDHGEFAITILDRHACGNIIEESLERCARALRFAPGFELLCYVQAKRSHLHDPAIFRADRKDRQVNELLFGFG